MKNRIITLFACVLLLPTLALAAPDVLPVPNTVTVIDLGAKACTPCKMMAPILEKLEKEYADRAAIVFIDVWQDKSQAEKYGIRTIPTQIFFDKKGKERERHEGFLDEASMRSKIDALLQE